MRRLLAGLFAVLSLSLVMGACSSDSKKVADIVQDNLKKETNVPDLKVTCDKDLEAKKGNKGSCTASGDLTAYITSLGGTPPSPVTELKYDIEFTDDTTFTANPNQADFQLKGGVEAASPSDTSSADSTSSEDTSSSS
jgi:hypothetical protein